MEVGQRSGSTREGGSLSQHCYPRLADVLSQESKTGSCELTFIYAKEYVYSAIRCMIGITAAPGCAVTALRSARPASVGVAHV